MKIGKFASLLFVAVIIAGHIAKKMYWQMGVWCVLILIIYLMNRNPEHKFTKGMQVYGIPGRNSGDTIEWH